MKDINAVTIAFRKDISRLIRKQRQREDSEVIRLSLAFTHKDNGYQGITRDNKRLLKYFLTYSSPNPR